MPCPLETVLATHKLFKRTARVPSITVENEALHRLSRGLLQAPERQLQELLECALTLCNAGSAGISLLEETGSEVVFRWVALAGKYKHLVGGWTPRHESPCGVTLRLGEPQLFEDPVRHFACLAPAHPTIVEGLVLPIEGVRTRPGTIWIVSHTPNVEFDMADVRVMTSLAGFAAFACQQLAVQRRAPVAAL